MAANLYVDPWQTVGCESTMLDHVMAKALGLLVEGYDNEDQQLIEHGRRYMDANVVLVFSDGTTRNDGPWFPFMDAFDSCD